LVLRTGFGLERPKQGGESLPVSLDGSPPGAVAAGDAGRKRRRRTAAAASSGERGGGGVLRRRVRAGAVRAKRLPRVPCRWADGGGVEITRSGPLLARGLVRIEPAPEESAEAQMFSSVEPNFSAVLTVLVRVHDSLS
jgi:hypothetical protein